VTSIEDAQRAIDQLTDRVNELLDRAPASKDGTSNTIVGGIDIEPIAYTMNTVVAVPHKLGRAAKGFSPTNNLSIVLAPKQPNPKTHIHLIVRPWEPFFFHSPDEPATQEIDILDLDGDRDERYKMEWNALAGVSGDWDIRPNLTITTNQDRELLFAVGAGPPGSNTATRLSFTSPPSGDWTVGELVFWAKTGKPRMYHSIGPDGDAGGVGARWILCTGIWTDTTTNITALRLRSASATGIQNMQLTVYRYKPLAKNIEGVVY
jgi:hypothetical protein